MSAPTRLAPTVCRFCRASPALRRTFASSSATTTTTTNAAAARDQAVWPQRQPRGEYYDILLRDPTPYASTKVEAPPSSASSSSSPAAPSETTTPAGSDPAKTYDTIASRTAYADSNSGTSATAAERARVIFGSRLLGPAERADRAAGRQAKSTTVAGVRVPPQPEEPDNCCMSGCVNCVWDLYREEMEEWTLASAAARKRLAESAASAASAVPRGRLGPFGPGTGGSGLVGGGPGQGGSGGVGPRPMLGESTAAETATSMDADGGGSSETNWTGDAKIAKDMWTDDLFQNVPVGIREFMKQEKRLKEKHQREGTSGG
ncbi:hypothetical protein LMH87_011139 [Akanthomyces muscarius]|uniref:Oxidoreductase-like domain-containing protein n=1 Tax=Akanthomyces muscarius TaxID=2231603 RepID=A0A9W8Q8K5_AKAMU|nr:hypothetical protein LMH87_011139 [Akanthomyces muscarius]KAJ4150387.1 hypothetical protein LMH87_011139 [Akanthomyces muscarius]